MKFKYRLIAQEQLGSTFRKLSELKSLRSPVKGWLRSIRSSLGMSGVQLGKRIGVSQPRIVQIEKDELAGTVTMNTMRQVAEAMDCVFVYAVIPRISLEHTLKEQAEKIVDEQFSRSSHTMLLEDQSISKEEYERMRRSRIDDLIREPPIGFWEDK